MSADEHHSYLHCHLATPVDNEGDAMTDLIIIDYEELGTLVEQAGQTSQDLADVGSLPGADLTHSPRTRDGLDDFQGEWDKRRGELVEALDAVTQALSVISSVFADADAQMTAAIQGEG